MKSFLLLAAASFVTIASCALPPHTKPLPNNAHSHTLTAGGVGIDTAWDYNDQPDIKAVLGSLKEQRDKYFITTKLPAGLSHGNATNCAPDPAVALAYVKEDIRELGVEYVDLVLLHGPCELAQPPVKDPTASNKALWSGLQEAQRLGLTRSIGVSNYKVPQLKALGGPVPQLNQCQLSINGSFDQPPHDDATIAYCRENKIVYESYGALKGCPWQDAKLGAIAKAHGKSVAQVCLRWVVQQGAIVAAGTGANATQAAAYASENLAIFDFELAAEEMEYLSQYGATPKAPDTPPVCKTDSDCPCSYCMNDASKKPPYFCHGNSPGKGFCCADKDCPGSYCMDDPSKKPPFRCH